MADSRERRAPFAVESVENSAEEWVLGPIVCLRLIADWRDRQRLWRMRHGAIRYGPPHEVRSRLLGWLFERTVRVPRSSRKDRVLRRQAAGIRSLRRSVSDR